VTDETLGQLLTAVARMDMVIGDTTTTVGRSPGMTTTEIADAIGKVAAFLDGLEWAIDQDDPNWQRLGDLVGAQCAVREAAWLARRAANFLTSAASR